MTKELVTVTSSNSVLGETVEKRTPQGLPNKAKCSYFAGLCVDLQLTDGREDVHPCLTPYFTGEHSEDTLLRITLYSK